MRLQGLRSVSAALVLALLLSACGGSSASHRRASGGAAVASSAAKHHVASRVDARVLITSPRSGARVGEDLAVRVSVSGARTTGSRAFEYVLDGKHARLGPDRLGYQGLAPGIHRLAVYLVADPGARATVSFLVRAPLLAPPAPTTSAPSPTPAPAIRPTTQPFIPGPPPASVPTGGPPQ
jgi:hypothetical protein